MALITSWGCGIPIEVNVIPAFLSMFCIKDLCLSVQNVMQVPDFPALAVLPDLWIYDSTSFGGSTWITKATLGMSRPLAATSVATSTLIL